MLLIQLFRPLHMFTMWDNISNSWKNRMKLTRVNFCESSQYDTLVHHFMASVIETCCDSLCNRLFTFYHTAFYDLSSDENCLI